MSQDCYAEFVLSRDPCLLSNALRRWFGQGERVGWCPDPWFNTVPIEFWRTLAQLTSTELYRIDRPFADIEIYLDNFMKVIDVLNKKQRYKIRLLASALDVVFIHEFLHFVGLKDESEVSNAVRCFTLGGVKSSD